MAYQKACPQAVVNGSVDWIKNQNPKKNSTKGSEMVRTSYGNQQILTVMLHPGKKMSWFLSFPLHIIDTNDHNPDKTDKTD